LGAAVSFVNIPLLINNEHAPGIVFSNPVVSDDEGEGTDSKRRQNWSKKPVTGASKDLMLLWLRKSRTRRVYKRLVQVCLVWA
jgi:hypothetical protein